MPDRPDDTLTAPDASRGRRLEPVGSRYAKALEGLARSAIVINSQLSVEEMLTTITEQACEIIGAHLGSTSLTAPGTGAAEGWPQLGISVQLSEKYAAWRSYDAPSKGTPAYGLVCANNDVVRLTDAELTAHPAWRGFGEQAAAHPPMRGWLAAPLVASDGTNLGILQLSDKFEGDFDEQDETIVVQLAQLASVAIEKARLYEVAAEREQMRLRDELLSGLSHDMQTPLATIAGLVDLLREALDLDDPEQRVVFDALARQTDNLYLLVQQFLDYSRLQVNRELQLMHRPVEVTDAVRRVVGLFDHRREIRVGSVDPGPVVEVDPMRLQQVLANVLSNAVKFSDEPITVRVEADPDAVLVHVDDHGIGLPDLDHPEIVFERFFRGPSAAGTPGTGLGLYVSRTVMRAMDGDVTAEPRDGGGSRFTVRIPRAADA